MAYYCGNLSLTDFLLTLIRIYFFFHLFVIYVCVCVYIYIYIYLFFFNCCTNFYYFIRLLN